MFHSWIFNGCIFVFAQNTWHKLIFALFSLFTYSNKKHLKPANIYIEQNENIQNITFLSVWPKNNFVGVSDENILMGSISDKVWKYKITKKTLREWKHQFIILYSTLGRNIVSFELIDLATQHVQLLSFEF